MCNWIVVGFCDVLVVVEIVCKGGLIIIVEYVNNYNCDVFVIFGCFGELMFEGCNWLIKLYKVFLLELVSDFVYFMYWQQSECFVNE